MAKMCHPLVPQGLKCFTRCKNVCSYQFHVLILRISISSYLSAICILVYWFTAKCLSPNSKSIIHLFPCEDLLCRALLAYLWVTVQTFHRRSFKNLCLLQMETSQKSQKKVPTLTYPTYFFASSTTLLLCIKEKIMIVKFLAAEPGSTSSCLS